MVTIDELPCCSLKPGTIPGLAAGTWEIIAEIDYPDDTRPENNRVIRRLEVLDPKAGGKGGAEGGAITD